MRYIILILFFGCYRPEPSMMDEKITFKVYGEESIPIVIRQGVNTGEYFMTPPRDTLTIIRYFKIGEIITFGAIRKSGKYILAMSLKQYHYPEVVLKCVVCRSITWRIK